MKDWTKPSYFHLGAKAERVAMEEETRLQRQIDQAREQRLQVLQMAEEIDE